MEGARLPLSDPDIGQLGPTDIDAVGEPGAAGGML